MQAEAVSARHHERAATHDRNTTDETCELRDSQLSSGESSLINFRFFACRNRNSAVSLLARSSTMAAQSSYTPVSMSDSIELADVTLDSAVASDSRRPHDPPLTKRAIYSSHRVEARTPRMDGETDAAYKRRVTTQHINAIIHSIGWVLAALAIIYYTDIWNVVRYDTRVNQSVRARR
jgi:hypothetical protein